MGTIEYVDPEEELFFTFMSQRLPLLQQPTGKIKDLVYQAIIEQFVACPGFGTEELTG